MIIKFKTIFSVCTLLVIGLSQNATADLILTFSNDDGVTFGDNLEITDGQTGVVSIYLAQTDPTTLLSVDGLTGFGLSVDLESTGAGTLVSSEVDSAFDFVQTEEFTETTALLDAAAFFNSTPVASMVRLGSFEFSATRQGTATLSIGDIRPGDTSADVNWLSGTGAELDQLVFGSGSANRFDLTLSVVPVPEPGYCTTIALLFGSLSTLSMRRKRIYHCS
ncbi:MAG: hypothetical protein AAGA30_15595 [Planctomycetota bacterium]